MDAKKAFKDTHYLSSLAQYGLKTPDILEAICVQPTEVTAKLPLYSDERGLIWQRMPIQSGPRKGPLEAYPNGRMGSGRRPTKAAKQSAPYLLCCERLRGGGGGGVFVRLGGCGVGEAGTLAKDS